LNIHFQKPYLKEFVSLSPLLLDGSNDAHFGKYISNPADSRSNIRKPFDSASAVYISAVLHSRRGKSDSLQTFLLSVMTQAHAEPGSLIYNLYQQRDGHLFWFEVWRSQGDLDQHVRQPYVKGFKPAIDDLADSVVLHVGKLVMEN
jgi:quinol monooxygenase YgiN